MKTSIIKYIYDTGRGNFYHFSGQSDMVCLGSAVKDQPSEDQNMSFESIKLHNRRDKASFEWSTLIPGFGGDRNHFGPELYFGKVQADSMPDKKIAFIKDATSGTYLFQKVLKGVACA